MTEKEYIDLDNLSKVRTILTLVRDLLPDEIIEKDDKIEIETKLTNWRDKLQKKIKIK